MGEEFASIFHPTRCGDEQGMKTYAVRIGNLLSKVRGRENARGWLEWQVGEERGVSRPGTFSLWSERKRTFPGIPDEKDEESEC